MRAPLLVLLALASGAALVACIDLFHSTGDVLTACQRDAQSPGCAAEAGADTGTDFCAWSDGTALANAQHACAWLGACETPLGRNAFASCMFQAMLAYDCNANPSHPVKGTTHVLWDCLWPAKSCAEVDACVFPQGPQQCGGGPFVTCASQGGKPPNADVRVECSRAGASPSGENCALWGQTCGGNLSEGICGGSVGAAAIGCTVQGCDDTRLHACDDAGYDIGIDCMNNGAQQCGGFPSATNAAWVACLPESDAGKCTPDASAACSDGIATSCPAGVPETINCQLLLQNTHSCAPGPLVPAFDWTSPCVVTADDAGEGGATPCAPDSCDGTTLHACYRGASFSVDCAALGFTSCKLVSTDLGAISNAACAGPVMP